MNKNMTAFCAAMLVCAILFAFCGAMWASGPEFSLAETGGCKIKTVYLTFDDGPSDRVTPKILDILKEENVKATFFIVGSQAETRKYILKREAEEGHKIGVHSYSHRYKEIYSSCESLLADIDKCNEVIKSATGKYSDVYRFPGGSFKLSGKFISAVTERGLRYVDWNASTRDAEIPDAEPEQLLNAAIATASDADNVVLLAHDSTTKSATAEALKDVIRRFKSKGYEFRKF